MDNFDSPVNAFPQPDPAQTARLLSRMTVLRPLLETLPVIRLLELCEAAEAGDVTLAAAQYHAMTSALLDRDTRRVTGDIWKDFLLGELFETPNRFSRLAAGRSMDPPIVPAMKNDLDVLRQLFRLNDATICEWIESPSAAAGQVRPQPSPPDKISRMAASAWSGGQTKPRHVPVSGPAPNAAPAKPAAWNYEEPGEPLAYAADDGLAVLYRQFLASDDWPELVQALADFHGQYGCGSFLRYRVFTADEEGLHGTDPANPPEWDSLIDTNSQKERLYANTLRFLYTGQGDDVLLCGADGMGKTSLVFSLTQELPDLRLVFMTARSLESALCVLRLLRSQPLRFIVFLDESALGDLDYRRLQALPGTDDNLLFYAALPGLPQDPSPFSLQIEFDMPDFPMFCACVRNMLRREHAPVPPRAIEDACAVWQERSDDFSIRAARRLAQQLTRAHAQLEE